MTEALEQSGIKVLPSGLVARSEAAKYLGRSTQTLRHWAVRGEGPVVVKVAGRAYYRLADLRALAGVAQSA